MTSLVLPLKTAQIELDDSIITRPASVLKAFTMAADLAGFDDKQASDAANMDAATWSRFKQGQVGIKPEAIERFLDTCGNELPLHHLAYRRGFHLVPRLTEMERRLAEERQRADSFEQENKLLRSLLVGRGA